MRVTIPTTHRIKNGVSIIAVTFLLLWLTSAVGSQTKENGDSRWSKNPTVRDNLIDLAEREEYTIRRIYIGGNTYTRFREFRERMLPDFFEGFVFIRRLLVDSVQRISKMKSIYPITIDDVDVAIDQQHKRIDFWINVKQKPHR